MYKAIENKAHEDDALKRWPNSRESLLFIFFNILILEIILNLLFIIS